MGFFGMFGSTSCITPRALPLSPVFLTLSAWRKLVSSAGIFYDLRLTCTLEHAEESHRQVYEQGEQYHHEAKFSHEAIAGAASFAGMKAWEDHQRKLGTSIPYYTP